MESAPDNQDRCVAPWHEALELRTLEGPQALRVAVIPPAPTALKHIQAWEGAREALEAPLGAGQELTLELPDDDALVDRALEALSAQGMVVLQLRYAEASALIHLARGAGRPEYPEPALRLRRRRDGRVWELDPRDEWTFGRSRDCTVFLDSPHASALHGSLRYRRRAVGLADLASSAGTMLDNLPMRRGLVDDFGLICLGRKETGHYLEVELALSPGRSPYLHVISGANAGATLPLLRPSHVLGRGAGCDPRVVAPYISRSHLRLVTFEHCLVLTDHESANGTRLDGRAIRRARLLPGDRLDIAGEAFEVLPPEGEELGDPPRLQLAERELAITEPTSTLGAGEDGLSFPSAGLSRHQVRFWRRPGGGLRMLHLCGVGDVRVNGEAVSDVDLRAGDTLEVGGLQGEVLAAAGEARDA